MARRRKMLSIALVVAGASFAPLALAAEPRMTAVNAPYPSTAGESVRRTATLDAPQDTPSGPVARPGSGAPSGDPQSIPYAHGGQPAARAPAVMSWRGGRPQSRLTRPPLRRRGQYRVAQAPLPGPGAPEAIGPGYESAPPPGSSAVEENFPESGDGAVVESGEGGPSLGYGGYRGEGDATPDFDPNQYQPQPYTENSYRDRYRGEAYEGDADGYDPSSMEMGYGTQGSDYAGGWEYGDGMGGCCAECENWSCRDVLCENFSLFGGVHAFKGSTDQFADGVFNRTTGGNFGFHEGANFAIPLIPACSIGMQAGGQVVHSNLSGTIGSDETRTQFFGTGGLFHRPQDGTGIQGGAVFDYLHDDFLVDMDLVQVRAELSIVGPSGNDVGFWGAFGVRDDDGVIPFPFFVPAAAVFEWKVIDQYAFFFRHEFYNGGNARVWAGFTGTGDGLLGFDASAPLSQRLTLQAGFNYLIPQEGREPGAPITETWGLGINLVFTPGHRRACSPFNPYRPLLPVADNNTFFVQQTNVTSPFAF